MLCRYMQKLIEGERMREEVEVENVDTMRLHGKTSTRNTGHTALASECATCVRESSGMVR